MGNRRMLKVLLIVALVSLAGWALVMFAFRLTAKQPDDLGVAAGRLRPCPETPNCVCSEDDGAAAIEPLRYDGDADEAWLRLRRTLEATARTKVVTATDDYLHAESTSLLFRFVDDIECHLDRDAKVIHVRSASRVGKSDLGVNRTRVEALRTAFAKE